MKKNKNLMLIGAAILIYFLFPKKKTNSAGGGESTNNSQPDNQLMRFKQPKNLQIRKGRQADVSGVII